MSRARGFTLLEVMVAVGVTAVERLLARSLGTIAADADRDRGMLLLRTLVAEAELAPPEPGHLDGERSGLRFAREVFRTPHPLLREVHVRVWTNDGGDLELVEVIRVPPA